MLVRTSPPVDDTFKRVNYHCIFRFPPLDFLLTRTSRHHLRLLTSVLQHNLAFHVTRLRWVPRALGAAPVYSANLIDARDMMPSLFIGLALQSGMVAIKRDSIHMPAPLISAVIRKRRTVSEIGIRFIGTLLLRDEYESRMTCTISERADCRTSYAHQEKPVFGYQTQISINRTTCAQWPIIIHI